MPPVAPAPAGRHTRRLAAALLAAAATLGASPARAILGGSATTAFAHVSSGVQITDNWVLTARHVGLVPEGLYRNGWGQAVIAQRYELGGGDFPWNDLALLRLATPIGGAPALGLLADTLPVGTLAQPLTVTIASGANHAPRGMAVAQVQEVIDQIDPDDDGPRPAVPVSWLLSFSEGSGPVVQGGDSGGGLFLGAVADSSGALLLGITSAQLQDEARQPVGSGFVQLASYRGWIDATLAADGADTQAVRWVSQPVPEPASAALLAAGGAGLAAWARRRRPAGGPT